ncbi:acid-sensing ion channel 2-like [Montipora foliosa]|uniref:acid-sensing ion channel 2-like n=1 Tax=Montipora foliosa TaxID=591990 RepID=UPI0035F106AC
MNDVALSKMSQDSLSQRTSWLKNEYKSSSERWHEFANDTSLHGIRYVFMKRRHFVIRLIWLVRLLSSAGYYIVTVYRAFNKFYSRPINTIISTKHLTKMEFPAVTICPLNFFAKSKLFVKDDDPIFAKSGLNISSCAVTSPVRGNRPCGLSLICCCAPTDAFDVYNSIPNCTIQYRQSLLDILKRFSHRLDLEDFYRYYSQDMNSLAGPLCAFGWEESPCFARDFISFVTQWGMCYTFNSGSNGEIRTVYSGGVSTGLSVLLDVQTHEHTRGKYSEGFKVLIHGRGEFVDEWEGINVGPGQHVVIAVSQKRYKNLQKPYATNCTEKKLRTFSTYTTEGCLHECVAEKAIEHCGCRPVGYREYLPVPTCSTKADLNCSYLLSESLDTVSCECFVPCYETKYTAEVSYSKFPDIGTAEDYVSQGYYTNVEYQRNNLVLLQIGFKSLNYEMQEQQPAYDNNALFGEIGGNMGLFLGCSLLTILEFIDFFIGLLATRRRQSTHPE